MIRKFVDLNKVALKASFLWTSFILTMIVLVIFLIAYFKGNLPELDLFIAVLLGAGIVFPAFIVLVGYLRWLWDYSIFRRNFNSKPFNLIDRLGFERTIKKSKWNFSLEYFTGHINGFIVDSEVETQYENKFVRFKFYVKPRKYEKSEFKEIQKRLTDRDGCFYFDTIIKRFHYKNHRLKTVDELERELIAFSELIKREKIEPSEFANR